AAAVPVAPGLSAAAPSDPAGPAPAASGNGPLLLGVGLALAALVAIFLLAGRKSGAASGAPAAKGGPAIDMTQRAGDPPGACMLLGKTGPKRGMTLEIDKAKGLVMGRSRTCDVIIADGRLSAQHLR